MIWMMRPSVDSCAAAARITCQCRHGGDDASTSNCDGWDSASPAHFGTTIQLPLFLSWDDPGRETSPWDRALDDCSVVRFVWCIED